MNPRKMLAAGSIAGSLLAGGLLGATVAGPLLASAASNSSTPAASASPNGSSNSNATTRKFVPNEDPAHEATESAAREAQENAGQFPTVP